MNRIRSSLNILFLSCLFAGSHLCADGQVDENFSDQDFLNNPAWIGDLDLFTVEAGVLRSNSVGAETYYLSTLSAMLDDTQWQFYVNLDFATSGANYVDVFLVADVADLSLASGYFIRIGGTPDEISFYKRIDGTNTLLIDGDDGVVSATGDNMFVIQMQRNAEGDWNLYYDENAQGSFEAGGSATDLSINTTAYFGVKIVQSSAAGPVNSHYFDDIFVGSIPIDETAPSLTDVSILSPSELQLTFSEPVSELSAEDITNYTMSSEILIIEASLSSLNSAQVSIELSLPMTSGQVYTLTVNGVEDFAGNATQSSFQEFVYIVSATGQSGEVVFNEIFPDPTPSEGLPEVEFLELLNTSSSFFDLAGWQLVNSNSVRTLSSKILEPGGYLILCNSSAEAEFSGFGDVLGIASFTALTNSGDSLTLKNSEGSVIDIVSYKDSWYNDPDKAEGGYTLELINPNSPCSGSSNWTASSASIGGTPGTINSVFDDTPDTSSPTLISYSIESAGLLLVTFSESMDATSLLNGSYTIDQGIGIAEIIPASDANSVFLSLSPGLQPGPTYILTVNGLTDCAGNNIMNNTQQEIRIGAKPKLYELLISEIMADPTPAVSLPEGEYFELFNAGDTDLEIKGCRLNDKVFQASRILLPGEYLLCVDEDNAEDFIAYSQPYFLDDLGLNYLTNGGRKLTLYNSTGDFIDKADYDLSWYQDADKNDGGYSLERINLSEPCRGASNWTASAAKAGGTPGATNASAKEESDTSAPFPFVIYVWSETQFELNFDEAIDSLTVNAGSLVIEPDLGIAYIETPSQSLQSLTVSLSSPMQMGTTYSLSVLGIADCLGNTMSSAVEISFALPELGHPGDLLINEVLFNPRTGGSDFVEIVNVSSKVISLQNWSLQNSDGNEKLISEKPLAIFPDDYLVLTANPDNISQEYPFGKKEKFLKMESLPTYNNDRGTVLLVNDEEITIDRFDYTEEFHFALLNTFKGVSLERLSFTRPTNDGSNWNSAAENSGFATPGYRNSQYSPNGSASADFELENDVFSPDNDGFQDVLNINYVLAGAGFLATVTIYDRRGRQVRVLLNNELMATEGTFSWDGITDDRTKARIGPYIIFIEVFDLSGAISSYKIPCVVAGRFSD